MTELSEYELEAQADATMKLLCWGEDPELWFGNQRQRRKGKTICNRCPVRQACLEHALTHRIKYGIWGGKDEVERAKLLRPKRKPQTKPANRTRASIPKPPPSQVRGVSWKREQGSWVVVIRHGGQTHWVGMFREQADAEAAAIAKCEALGTTTVRQAPGRPSRRLDMVE